MFIAYYSLTGNVRRFVRKLGRPPDQLFEISTGREMMAEPFVLITPTVGFGQIPGTVSDFLALNGDLLRGVAASGNRNWGPNFAKAADLITEMYDVPLLLRFELAGNDEDVRNFNEGVVWLSEITSN